MPCYDKKLEASRSDFYNDVYSTRDVDCVITTGELELLMKEKNWDITQPIPGELDDDENSHDTVFDPFLDRSSPLSRSKDLPDSSIMPPPVPQIHFPELLAHPGTSSGSYLHSIIAHLCESSPVPLTLKVQTVRGADYEEFVLSKNGGETGQEEVVVFKGAKCYGFRNLQNVVRRVGRERGLRTTTGAAGKMAGRTGAGGARRLKRRAGDLEEEKKERAYDYVEVMACPGGCVNGGGQLKPVLTTPAPSTVDEEGFKRDWEGNGVIIAPPTKDESGTVDVLQNARWGSKEWTQRVEEEYWKEEFNDMRNRQADGLARRVCDDLCGFGDDLEREESRRKFFRTQYRAVESEVIGLAVVW